jgi:hypothetical protein
MLAIDTQDREIWRHSHAGKSHDCFKQECASPLLPFIGKDVPKTVLGQASRNYTETRQRLIAKQKNAAEETHDAVLVRMVESTMEKRIDKLEDKLERLAKYTKELAKFANELEARVEKQEKQSLVYAER